MSDLLPHDFAYLADMLLKEGGMVVEPDKQYLVATRLMPVATKHKLNDLAALITKLRNGNDIIKHDVVDAMTVNETSFFRDPRVWDEIGRILLPQVFEHCKVLRRLDIWIAASSSGQEVYTLAMLLQEVLGTEYDKWRIQIVASDLSREMVERTRRGYYSDYEVSRGLSSARRDRFMTKQDEGWVINDDLRSLVRPREGNLTAKDMGVRGPFDLIMLRNVLIYFKPAMRTEILARQADLLNKNGRLVLGASEGALGVPKNLQSVRTGSLVSYGRADSDVRAKAQPRNGLSAATSALMAQFPKDKDGKASSLGSPSPLTQSDTKSKLSALAAKAPATSAQPLTFTSSGAKTTKTKPLTTSKSLATKAPAPAPSTGSTPNAPSATDGGILGKAKVDEDGLTPLERLRALRKEYQQ